MQDIETTNLIKIQEAYSFITVFANRLSTFMDGIQLPATIFSGHEELDITAEDSTLETLNSRLISLGEAGMPIFCEVYCILEDVTVEMQKNSLKSLGRKRRIAYTNQCRDALLLLKDGKQRVEILWESAQKDWHYTEHLADKTKAFIKKPLAELSTEYGLKIAKIANAVKYEAQSRIADLNHFCKTFEDQINRYLPVEDGKEASKNIISEKESYPISLETASRKSRKKENITLKQQMILLDTLGFLEADVWGTANATHKAFILSHLLNRSVQEVRGMLTYWKGLKPPFNYDCTGADDNDAIADMVLGKGLNV